MMLAHVSSKAVSPEFVMVAAGKFSFTAKTCLEAAAGGVTLAN